MRIDALRFFMALPLLVHIQSGGELASMDNFDGAPLSAEERAVILGGATEAPFKGKYDNFYEKGIYSCRRCGAALYGSKSKFDAGCGWPAFDESFPLAVAESPDKDGKRTEISCAHCGGHLGHIFKGEKFTEKNVRHCVNSLSMDFIPEKFIGKAVLAGGCFWGVEYIMRGVKGVLSARSGYCGGSLENPTYRQVCSGKTGHLESVEVLFDKRKTNYENVLRAFFESHDFTQTDGQGPDLGEQYKSAVFAQNAEQAKCAEKLLGELRKKGFVPATRILPKSKFYPAEDFHQRYYERKGTKPYCHVPRKIF